MRRSSRTLRILVVLTAALIGAAALAALLIGMGSFGANSEVSAALRNPIPTRTVVPSANANHPPASTSPPRASQTSVSKSTLNTCAVETYVREVQQYLKQFQGAEDRFVSFYITPGLSELVPLIQEMESVRREVSKMTVPACARSTHIQVEDSLDEAIEAANTSYSEGLSASARLKWEKASRQAASGLRALERLLAHSEESQNATGCDTREYWRTARPLYDQFQITMSAVLSTDRLQLAPLLAQLQNAHHEWNELRAPA